MLFVVNDGVFIYEIVDDVRLPKSVSAMMLGPGSKRLLEGEVVVEERV